MTLDEYQTAAGATDKPTRVFDETGRELFGMFNALGLNGEAGEAAEKVKKYARDGGDPGLVRTALMKELGDTLWYLAAVARNWGLTLDEIAEHNLEKLRDRKARGTLFGSGDNR